AAKGFEAEHVYDVELGEAEDNRIWAYAKHANATVITKDEDFIVLASFDPNGPPIVWVRLGVTVHSPLGARASRPLKWRPRWPRSQEKAGGSERLRLGNTTKQALLVWFEPLLPTIVSSLEEGNKLVELTNC
ncbi:MAG: DUF5615 family PIN-like protein, partial [Candidatus Methylumidiphilus sp.]